MMPADGSDREAVVDHPVVDVLDVQRRDLCHPEVADRRINMILERAAVSVGGVRGIGALDRLQVPIRDFPKLQHITVIKLPVLDPALKVRSDSLQLLLALRLGGRLRAVAHKLPDRAAVLVGSGRHFDLITVLSGFSDGRHNDSCYEFNIPESRCRNK